MNKPLCDNLEIPVNLDLKSLKIWLERTAEDNQLNYLLAHAEDGVIWGKFQDKNLLTADSVFLQFSKLRCSTLQQCRIFGEKAEVMIWKSEGDFKARLIRDDNIKKCEYITEKPILYGTHGKKNEGGFTLLWDGSQGLKHAIPLTDIELEKDGKLKNPVSLIVNHYIDYDDSGVAHIYLSRLVNLTTSKEI